MKELSKRDQRELQRIQDSIPKEWMDKLIVKRAITPTMAKIVDLALKEDLTPDQRERYQTLKDSGVLEQKEESVNRSVEKKIKKYVDAEYDKSVRAGRLSVKPKKK